MLDGFRYSGMTLAGLFLAAHISILVTASQRNADRRYNRLSRTLWVIPYCCLSTTTASMKLELGRRVVHSESILRQPTVSQAAYPGTLRIVDRMGDGT